MKVNGNDPNAPWNRDDDEHMIECPDCDGDGRCPMNTSIKEEGPLMCSRCAGTGEIPDERTAEERHFDYMSEPERVEER